MVSTDVSLPTGTAEGLTGRHRSVGVRRRWRRGGAALSLCLATAGAAAAAGSAGAAPKQLQNVTLATTSAGTITAVLDTAQQKGFFAAQGLTVTVSKLNTTLAVEAVEAGKIDYETGAGATPDAAALHGQPVKTYAALIQRETFILVGAPNITKITQLKGTTVATEPATALNTVYLTRLLTKEKLLGSVNVANVVNNSAAAISYLEAGKASASVLTYTPYLKMPPGYHILYKFYAPKSPFYTVTDGVVANTQYVSTHQTQLRKLIRAMVNAKNYFVRHKKKVLPIIEKAFTITPSKAAKAWKASLGAFTTNGKPASKAITFQASLDQFSLKLTKPPPASKLYTWKYVPT